MAIIKLKLFVSEISNVISLFDSIQIQRSESGSPFADAKFITATVAAPPVLLGTEEEPYAVQGKSIHIKVNGTEKTVTFTMANPETLAQVIEQFNASIGGAVMSSVDSKPKITGSTTGTAGTLEITGGTAIADLGFTSGQKDNGEDLNIPLLAGVDAYVYDDQSGGSTYWYRERYYNSISGTYGSWADWVQGSVGAAIPDASLIIGRIKLSDIDGTALSGAKVGIVNVYKPLLQDGYFMAGRYVEIETDGVGQAEVTLIKGSTIDVVIVGTSIIRRILVPSSGTEFDLMNPALVQDDPFQIQIPDLPSAPRST